jgi:hypothetical protein
VKDGRLMVNWKGFGRNQSWSNPDIIPTFNRRETSEKMAERQIVAVYFLC